MRELLKADALEKLKMSCPTLFALGWFKVIIIVIRLHLIKYSQENAPKDEETLKKELEELQSENDELARKKDKEIVRERQVSNDEFITL